MDRVADMLNFAPMNSSNDYAKPKIEEWRAIPDRLDTDLDMLAEILHAVVHGGAGVSFYVPFTIEESRKFWEKKVLPSVCDGTRRVLIARLDERILGTVQLEIEMPPNQQHRGAVAKLLVHPDARRLGLGKTLMLALEDIARSEGRTLLTLDTVTGSAAETLYTSLGYVTVGVIPRFARGSLTSDLDSTTIMYKELS